MATLDDILTTQKNGVVAINNLSESLNSLYAAYVSSIGNKTSTSISSATTVVTGTSRLVSLNVTTAGSAGTIYDSLSATVTNATGTGTAATLTYNGYGVFAIGDLITVVGMNPAGYNTTNATVTAITNTTVTYANATSSAFVSGGTLLNSTSSRIVAAIPATIGNWPIGSYFKKGITVLPGASQVVTVNYYTS